MLPEFYDILARGYRTYNREINVMYIVTLKALGIIKAASYSVFGHGDSKYIYKSYEALKRVESNVKTICEYKRRSQSL